MTQWMRIGVWMAVAATAGACSGGGGGGDAGTDSGADTATSAEDSGQDGGTDSGEGTATSAEDSGQDGGTDSGADTATSGGDSELDTGTDSGADTAQGCTADSQCAKNWACVPTGCGDSAPGLCQPVALIDCSAVYEPVCGCDGTTYSNACTAMVARQAVAHEGACDDTCQTTGDCGTDQYCSKASCGAAAGACTDVPQICPDVYLPVCGCDGVTYGNQCEAAAAGQNLAHEGACDDTCQTTGDCGANQYCSKASCGAAEGTCGDMPMLCPTLYAPVCGCDGVTYGNACEAAAAGQNLAHEGACP